MPFINPATLEAIRRDPTAPLMNAFLEVEDRMLEMLVNVYAPGDPARKLGHSGLLLVFCSMIAGDLVPYGRSANLGPLLGPARTLRKLLTAAQMHCGHYCLLSLELFRNNRPITPDIEVEYQGWKANTPGTGLHGQIYVRQPSPQGKPALECFIDPTTALVVCAPRDFVYNGGKVQADQAIFLAVRQAFTGDQFAENVRNAFITGTFRGQYAETMPEAAWVPYETNVAAP